METADQRQWVIRRVDEDAVAMEQPDGTEIRLHRSLLPEDIEPGDRLRVVARIDRRTAEPAPIRLCGLPGVRRG